MANKYLTKLGRMARPDENGKAFEYAIANSYFNFIKNNGLNVSIVHDEAYLNAKKCFDIQHEKAQESFVRAATNTIETLVVLEPGLTTEKNNNDILKIRIAKDAEGIAGDVRDVIFSRDNIRPKWVLGFSAKNNHEAVKHSRLSMSIDFGKTWLNHPCSQDYFNEIKPIFDLLSKFKQDNPSIRWNQIPQKHNNIYIPILSAFRKELLRLSKEHNDVPQVLLNYLIGNYPFYKIIKDDNSNLVVVKAFNILGRLNKNVNGVKPKAKAEKIKLPTRIIEFDFKQNSETTLMMVLDEGWQISFRIHSADGPLTNSLKFDIQLIGNPPILFTQHLFNINEIN